MNKNKIAIIISILSIAVLAFVYYFFGYNKEVISYTAQIAEDSETITINESGILNSLYVEDKDRVTIGQIIAEIKTEIQDNNCSTETLSKEKQETEYQDAALMYKDGIITKDEYDNSIENIKEEIAQKSNCNDKNYSIQKIYATKDGIIELQEGAKINSKLEKETPLAKIKPEKQRIIAYFSPKLIKDVKEGTPVEITIIKYPEKAFTGTVDSLGAIDIKGRAAIININEDTSELNIKDNDNAIVKIVK